MTKILQISSLFFRGNNVSMNTLRRLSVLSRNGNSIMNSKDGQLISSQRRVIATSSSNDQNKPATQSKEEKAASFLNGTNANYSEEIYQAWLADPRSVHKSWDIYFRTNSVQSPPTLGQSQLPSVNVTSSPSQLNVNQLIQLL